MILAVLKWFCRPTKLPLNSEICSSFLSVGIRGVHHLAWLCEVFITGKFKTKQQQRQKLSLRSKDLVFIQGNRWQVKPKRVQDQSLFYPGHLWSLESPLPMHPHELALYLRPIRAVTISLDLLSALSNRDSRLGPWANVPRPHSRLISRL